MPELLSATEAAARKGCSRQTIGNAIRRGEINGTKVGPAWAVLDDDALGRWRPQETGGRIAKAAGADGA